MSNKNQPHHKFVQTFVLAEQPNGYFVLNDIFRYLSDDEDEIVDDEAAQEEGTLSEPQTPADANAPPPGQDELVNTESNAEEVDEQLEEIKDEEATSVAAPVNGEDEVTVQDSGVAPAESDATQEQEPETVPAEVPATEQLAEPTTTSTPPKAATPTPEAAPAKKTWASMVGGNAKPAVPALPAQPTQAAVPKPARAVQQPQAPKTTPTEPATSNASNQNNGWQTAGHEKKKGGPQAKQEEQTLAYIKNVNDKVDARLLRDALERYGELKYFDVSRPRVSCPHPISANCR